MDWIFSAFLVASILHVGEEYFYPGGFMDFMKRFNPAFAPLVTARMAIIVNGLQLVLCVIAMIVGRSALVFSMSAAGLLFINGIIHIGGCIREKGYAPGVVTAVLIYLPLSLYAYSYFLNSGQLSLNGLLVSGGLAVLYQIVPIAYLGLATALRRT